MPYQGLGITSFITAGLPAFDSIRFLCKGKKEAFLRLCLYYTGLQGSLADILYTNLGAKAAISKTQHLPGWRSSVD